MDRIGITFATGAVLMVLSSVEGVSHDWRSVWIMWWQAQATDMTTNQNLPTPKLE
jgi:hypothetical protein